MRQHVAVITAYNVPDAAVETLYFSSLVGIATTPASTPADTVFDPRIKNPVNITRSMFRPGATRGRSTAAVGELVLHNGDGGLDHLAGYAFDGREIVLYVGEGADFPSGYTRVWAGTMEDVDFDGGDAVVKLRDAQASLDRPLQTTLYDGDNVLPDGLEGVADLEGKPKPLVFGKVRNITAVLVNSSKLIYQVHDGAIESIDAVYDSGVPLSVNTAPAWEPIEPTGLGDPSAIIYDPYRGQFIATSASLTPSAFKLATSFDGLSWFSRTIPIDGGFYFGGLAFDDGLILAGGGSTTTSAPRAARSGDGVVWEEIPEADLALSGDIADVTVGPGEGASGVSRWLAVAGNGEVATSDDGGLTWTVQDTIPVDPPSVGSLRACAYGNGVFIVGGSGGVLETSPDGETWTARTSNVASIFGFAYSPELGRWVAAGDGISTSDDDGATWTARTTSFSGTNIVGVLWIPEIGVFLAHALQTTHFAISADGITWTQVTDGIVQGATEPKLQLAYHRDLGKIIYVGDGTISPTFVGSAYSSEADLLDNDLAPAPGAVGVYAAGGLFRLGSSPQGPVTADVTAKDADADMTAAQLFVDVLERAGFTNPENLQTEDDLTAWDDTGTPSATTFGVEGPFGEKDAYAIGDNDGAAVEFKSRNVSYTGDGTKLVEWLFRLVNPPAGGSALRLYDDDASAVRAEALVGEYGADARPTVTMSTGELVDLVYRGLGFWRLRCTAEGVVAANTNRLEVHPAAVAAETGTIAIYKPATYDLSEPAEVWDRIDIVETDLRNDAVCGYHAPTFDVPTSEALSDLANSIGAWWGPDRAGVLRLQVLRDPLEVVNGFSFPRDLSASAWHQQAVTITTDDRRAPDGSTTMDKIVEDSADTTHTVSRSLLSPFPYLPALGSDIVIEFLAAPDERRYLGVAIRNRANSSHSGVVDLETGAITYTLSTTDLVLEAWEVGDGVYLVRATRPAGASGVSLPRLNLTLSEAASLSIGSPYQGDGSSGLHVSAVRWIAEHALIITPNLMRSRPRRLGSALPTYRHAFGYRRNWTVQDPGMLAAQVGDVRRGVVSKAHQTVEVDDSAVQTAHLNARVMTIDTLIDDRADAVTEATRLQALRGVRRERFELDLHLNEETEVLDIGQGVEVVHPRYGLTPGQPFVILDAKPDARRKSLTIEVWG